MLADTPEARSAAAASLSRRRWAAIPPEARSEASRHAVRARWAKRESVA